MAILQGIQGMFLNDGAGGKIALDINRRVLTILNSGRLSFLTCTINEAQARAGTVWFDKPEIIQNEEYVANYNTPSTTADGQEPTPPAPAGGGKNYYQTPVSGQIAINIDKTRAAGYQVETFDLVSLANPNAILGQIASSLAMAMTKQLNATFLQYLVDYFAGAGFKQTTALDVLDKEAYNTPEACRQDLDKLTKRLARFTQIYDKEKAGIDGGQFVTVTSPIVHVNMMNAFWNQQGSLPMLLGREKYYVFQDIITIQDGMLQNKILKGESFSKDTDLDTSTLAAFMIHNEAIAMPIVYNGTFNMVNQFNGNPLFLAKYKYGIGLVRPDLIWAFTGTALAPFKATKEKAGKKAKDKANAVYESDGAIAGETEAEVMKNLAGVEK